MRFAELLKRKRSGISERAPYLLMFMLLFNVSSATVNSLQVFGYCLRPNPSFTGGATLPLGGPCSTPTDLSTQSSQSLAQSGCGNITVNPQTNAATCNPNIGNTATGFPNILIFGDWFGAMLSFIETFSIGLVYPGWILQQLGLGTFAGIFSAAMDTSWFLFLLWMRSGRPI